MTGYYWTLAQHLGPNVPFYVAGMRNFFNSREPGGEATAF